MRKFLKRPVTIGPLVVMALLVVACFTLSFTVKAGAKAVLPAITGTECDVRDVDVSLFSGHVGIGGLLIGNPEGCNTDSAFELGNVHVKFDPRSLLSNVIHIREIVIDGPKITCEISLTGATNTGTIQKHIEGLTADKPNPTEEEEAPEKPQVGRKVIIDRFVLRNGKVRVAGKQVGLIAATLPLPPVELTDFGKEEGGVPIADAAAQIFDVLGVGIEQVASGALAAVEGGIDAAKEGAGKAAGAVKDAGKGAVDSVKGLFK